MLIQVSSLNKSYQSGNTRLQVLKDLHFQAREAEMIGLRGASGSGKSTFLNILGTMDHADSGSIIVNGFDFKDKTEKDFTRFRLHELGFIFQFHYLLPEFTALENAAIPAMIAGSSPSNARKRAAELLDYLRVIDRAHHYPSELSGGEKQRVAIARALMNHPAVLLADEPTGNLDRENAHLVMDLMTAINRDLNQTIIMVSHDPELFQSMHRVYELQLGSLLSPES